MAAASCTGEQERRDARTALMSSVAFISAAVRGSVVPLARGSAASEELLIVGGDFLDAADELAREVAKRKGAGFGRHDG